MKRSRRKPMSLEERELAEAFGGEKYRSPRCANCGYEGIWLEVHHALEQQLLRRMLSGKGYSCPVEVLWDRRAAIVTCTDPAPNRCHERHSLAFQRMGAHVLRHETWDFAQEHGLEHVLEARYGQEAA